MKNITIKEFMTPNVALVAPDATLAEAARKMRQMDCGFLPVGSKDKLLGVITDRDIVIRALAKGKSPSSEIVREFMTSHVYACNENDFLEDAIDKMHEHKVTRLVVKNRHGQATGVISLGGILRQEATSHELSQAVKNAVYPEVV